MSWIGGEIILRNDSKAELDKARKEIREEVRNNGNLNHFPNLGNDLFGIKKISDRVFPSEKEARKFIDDRYGSWSRRYNVYVEFIDTKETSKIKSLKERLKATREKKEQYIKKEQIINHKSSLIGCKHCGSKIAREFLKNDYCPVCGTDLRSETVIKTIARYDEIIDQCLDDIEYEEAKQLAKSPKKVLLSYEEYVG